MRREEENRPLPLGRIQVTDAFWKTEMELVRTEVIPYQWEALNDRVEGAAPSFCMRNFRVAGKLNRERTKKGAAFEEPKFTFRGFEALPEDMDHLEDKFYGFVFQDSDFSKWIEAVGYSLTQHPDAELERIADEAIEIVCAAQQEDGYLDTYYIINGKDRIFTNLRDHHELYCFGHLTEGAVSYYQATGKDKLLRAAERFADYIAEHIGIGEGKKRGYPGHEIAEMALVRLYELTGERKYFELSRYFIDERGRQPWYFDREHPEAVTKSNMNGLRHMYHQAHLPVREQKEAVGHAVRAVYLYSGMADVARLTGDEDLYEACRTLWKNIVEQKMYITGGIGATHLGEAFSFNYDLPNDTAYAETCASIGLVFFARRMLQIRPDSRYADVMETALYNGILSGMSLDGRSFFYVNPLEAVPEACRRDERKLHVKPVRQKWFGCACCPPNLARLLSSIGAYAYTEKEDTLFLHLYMGSDIIKRSGGKDITVHVETEFPWDGAVRIRIGETSEPFTLALRIPGWAGSYGLSGDGGARTEERDGYLYITKRWTGNEELKLNFPMEVRLMTAGLRVREDIGKAAVMRGPVVYCLEEADNGKDLHLLSLARDSNPAVEDFQICTTPVKMIHLDGFRMTEDSHQDTPGESALYQTVKEVREEAVRLHYIPYFTWANRGENEMQVWTRQKSL